MLRSGAAKLPNPGAGSGAPIPDRRARPRRRHRVRRLLRHRAAQVMLAAFVVFLAVVGWSVGTALAAPGNTSTVARVAEWARGHYLGPVVTFGEWLTYQSPKVGGKPATALTVPSGQAVRPSHRGTTHTHTHSHTMRPLVPPRMSSPAGTPLPGEGVWRVLASVHGVPAMYGTDVRPDSTHTSYLAGVVSMDPRLLTFHLHPGVEDPGPANWGVPYDVPAGYRRGLLATFNGGFKIASAGGGFYLNGVTKGTLTDGAASLVFYRDGKMAIGTWGKDVRMTPNVVGVRQNLRLVVIGGQIPASVNTNIETGWGATLGGSYDVWRSGVGVTRDGRIVFVYGPALSVHSLADLLKRAGAVTAMQLDINPYWMSFEYYRAGNHPANPTPVNFLPTQQQPADRYYSVNSRDFVAAFAR